MSTAPITIFGEADPVSLAVVDGISARGRQAHVVSAETGVLSPARECVADADTPAGVAALRSLREAEGEDPVVVLSSVENGPGAVATVRETCRSCVGHRGVTVLWHESSVEPEDLAAEVVKRIEQPAPVGELVEQWVSDGS